MHFLVIPAPHRVAAVAGPLHAFLDDVSGHRLEVVCPSDSGHGINEKFSDVEGIVPELSGLVVPGESVMVVVESFAEHHEGDRFGFHGVDVLVVRLGAPQMGSGVHQPGHVQYVHVAEDGAHEVRVPQRFAPQGGDVGRQHEADQGHEDQVVSAKKILRLAQMDLLFKRYFR